MEQSRHRLGSFVDLGIRFCIYASILVLPLAYWPTLGEPHTVPKIGLLWLLAAWGFVLWVLRTILWRQGRELLQLPLIPPLLMLVLSFALSSAFSINDHLSLFGNYYRKEGLFTFLAYLSFYPMVATTFRSRHEIRSLLEVMLVTSSICSVIGLSQILGLGFGPPMTIDLRVPSTFGNSNFSGQFFAISSILALGLLLLYHAGWKKLLALLVFGANIFMLLETYTRGAWVAFGFVALLMIVLGIRVLFYRNRAWVGGIVVLVVLSLFVTYLLPGAGGYSLIARLESLFSENMFFRSRGVYWQQGLNVAESYPILGSGPETLRLAYRPLISEAYLEREQVLGEINSDLDRAHNEFIDVAAMRGLVGLVIFLFFLVSFLVLWSRFWRRSKDRYTRGLLLVLLCGWSAYLIADLFNFGMAGTTPYFWILGGAVASFTFILPRYGQPKEKEEPDKSQSLARDPARLGGTKSFWWWFPLVALCGIAIASFATYQTAVLFAADYNYGVSLQVRQQGDKAQAVQLNQRATELYPMEGQYWLGLGVARIDLALTQTSTDEKVQLLQAARESLERGKPLTDQPEWAWNNIGISYWHEAECWGPLDTDRLTVQSRALLEKARENFIACTQFDRTLPPSWLFLSGVDNLLGHWQEAGDAATRVLQIDPESLEAYLSMAKAEIGLGDTSSARHYLDVLLEKDPQNEEGKVLLEELAKSP